MRHKPIYEPVGLKSECFFKPIKILSVGDVITRHYLGEPIDTEGLYSDDITCEPDFEDSPFVPRFIDITEIEDYISSLNVSPESSAPPASPTLEAPLDPPPDPNSNSS